MDFIQLLGTPFYFFFKKNSGTFASVEGPSREGPQIDPILSYITHKSEPNSNGPNIYNNINLFPPRRMSFPICLEGEPSRINALRTSLMQHGM